MTRKCGSVWDCRAPAVMRVGKSWLCIDHVKEGYQCLTETDKAKFDKILDKAEKKKERQEKAAARMKEQKERKMKLAFERRKYLSDRAEVVVCQGGYVLARSRAVVDLCVPQMLRYAAFRSKSGNYPVHVSVDYSNELMGTARKEKFEFFRGFDITKKEDDMSWMK